MISTDQPRIAVLMSTYNGEAFLHEQIDSILTQKDVEVDLIVRDDGSRDDTLPILKYYENDGRLRLIPGKNKGVTGSFFELLSLAGDSYEYYAFADQDDVWKPDKLSKAFEKLSITDAQTPAMYYSRLEFVSASKQTLGLSAIPTTRGFHNALVQNQATGCTVVLNRTARNLIAQHLPSWALMHDWWCYLLVSAFGCVIYDEYPGILYRKHGNNVTPATPNFALELLARFRRFMGKGDIPEKVSDQAKEFNRIFGERLREPQKVLLQGFIQVRSKSLPGRLRYALRMPVQRNTPLDNLIMRVLFIIGRF